MAIYGTNRSVFNDRYGRQKTDLRTAMRQHAAVIAFASPCSFPGPTIGVVEAVVVDGGEVWCGGGECHQCRHRVVVVVVVSLPFPLPIAGVSSPLPPVSGSTLFVIVSFPPSSVNKKIESLDIDDVEPVWISIASTDKRI